MTDVATSITVPDGKTTLDELLARVEAGEEIVITRNGALVARMMPAASEPALVHPVPTKPRQFGLYAGWGTLGPAFFEPLPEEELRRWEGGE